MWLKGLDNSGDETFAGNAMHSMVICLTAGNAIRTTFDAAPYDFAVKSFLGDNFTHKRAKTTGDVVRLNGKDGFETRENGEQVSTRRRIERRNSYHGCTDLTQLEFARRA